MALNAESITDMPRPCFLSCATANKYSLWLQVATIDSVNEILPRTCSVFVTDCCYCLQYINTVVWVLDIRPVLRQWWVPDFSLETFKAHCFHRANSSSNVTLAVNSLLQEWGHITQSVHSTLGYVRCATKELFRCHLREADTCPRFSLEVGTKHAPFRFNWLLSFINIVMPSRSVFVVGWALK